MSFNSGTGNTLSGAGWPLSLANGSWLIVELILRNVTSGSEAVDYIALDHGTS
jgi:hypothetical protein